MGLFLVFGFWATAFGILGSVMTAILWAATAFLTREAQVGRKRALTASIFAPWVCIGIWIVGTIGYAAINVIFLGRDLGFGDSYETPVPTGYSLEAIDTLDFGAIYATNSLHRADYAQPIAYPVFQLQIDRDIAAGSTTSKSDLENWSEHPTIDRYFMLDMKSSKVTNFDSLGALNAVLAQRGFRNHLKPFAEVFAQYRATRFDWLAFSVAACVPLVALAILIWLIRRARRTIDRFPTEQVVTLAL